MQRDTPFNAGPYKEEGSEGMKKTNLPETKTVDVVHHEEKEEEKNFKGKSYKF